MPLSKMGVNKISTTVDGLMIVADDHPLKTIIDEFYYSVSYSEVLLFKIIFRETKFKNQIQYIIF